MKLSMQISNKKIRSYVESFPSLTVGVIGDVMLDTFTYGKIERMSPEAPVPIVLIETESRMLGGSANVAKNVKFLGATVHLYGTVGNDVEGVIVTKLLEAEQIRHPWGADTTYQTIEKRRVIVENEHQIRIDKEIPTDLSEDDETALFTQLECNVNQYNVLIISDYAKGCITKSLATKIIALASKHRIPVVVDTKPGRQLWFTNVALLTPNASEIMHMTGHNDITIAGNTLSELTNSPVLATQGANGMTLFEERKSTHLPVTSSTVIDVSGAGDTVIASCALGIASGASLKEAMVIANYAAGIAVSHPGTAAVHQDELLATLTH